jgi:iron(III) transport system ATP-binding protein
VGDKLVSSPRHSLPPEKRNMSMIFQSYALWPHMTVAENIIYGLKLRKMDRDTIGKKLDAILATTRLAPLAQRYPGELSGGQQQRVALARALIVEPETLLLDEPLSNLDANLREEMRFEVRRLHDAYRYTTVYVTHDQSEAMTTADLIAVMNAGKIEQAGSPEDIYDRPRSEFVARFIGSSNVVKGKGLDAARVDFAGTPLRCVGEKINSGVSTPVSIRPHDIAISATQRQGENVVPATVVRQVFLGGNRDYMVEAKDGTQLRILTAAGENIPQGSAVWLHLPPERCRALSG